MSENRSFTLTIDITPRFIEPHPFTNQGTVALARGPIVYCVEDVDNTWVTDHFQSVQLHPSSTVQEKVVACQATGDTYVALKVVKGASFLQPDSIRAQPGVDIDGRGKEQTPNDSPVLDELNFIPFYFRANRGGKGHARVGLRRWNRSG